MKSGPDFDPNSYSPVAERIRLFYHAHPGGRIITKLVRRTRYEVVFKALVYRAVSEPVPAATGWAAEREGDGDINLVACLENTETSAIGRALANLGFTASKQRPSAEEMAKASRARVQARKIVPMSNWAVENATRDALALLAFARSVGLSAERVQSLRSRVDAGLCARSIERLEVVLRNWLRQQGAL